MPQFTLWVPKAVDDALRLRCACRRSAVEAGAAAGERECAALGGKRECVLDLHPLRKGVREPRGEAIARAVGVLKGAGRHGGLVGPARLAPAAEGTGRGDDDPRGRIEIARLVTLSVVLAARNQRVELDTRRVQGRQLPRSGDGGARAARLPHRLGVARGEVDTVHAGQLLPRQCAVAALRPRLLADHRDRALARLVDVTEAPPLRLIARGRVDVNTCPLELLPAAGAELVSPEAAVERGRALEPGQLDGRDAPAARGLRPPFACRHDLAGLRHRLHAEELDPLDVPDDRHVHGRTLTDAAGATLEGMMEAGTAIPPFESFYVEHREVVLGFLRRRLGSQAAEDAFQETFLRALRAYDRLEHGDHLRAWVLTIAARVVIDTSRRARPVAHEL